MSTVEHSQPTSRSNCGHLVRRLRLLESLIFERLDQRFAMTLVNCHTRRIGLAFLAAETGWSLVTVRRDGDRRVRFDWCSGPGSDVCTVERHLGEPLTVMHKGKACVALSAQLAGHALELKLDIPALGAVRVDFTPEREAARLYIVADRSVRVFPSKHHYH